MGNFASTPQMITAEKILINELVNNNCVVVFSKTQCIYCKKVKKAHLVLVCYRALAEKLFNESNIDFVNVELDKRNDGINLQDALLEITGARTVPRVFINGKCIGGASESERLYKENKLLEKIHECGGKQRF